jgi:hypothetical protein
MYISNLKFENVKIQSSLGIYMRNIFEFRENSTKKSSALSGLKGGEYIFDFLIEGGLLLVTIS